MIDELVKRIEATKVETEAEFNKLGDNRFILKGRFEGLDMVLSTIKEIQNEQGYGQTTSKGSKPPRKKRTTKAKS